MRYADWETRLGGFLGKCRSVPFAYGKHDCCTFASGAVLAMTGVDAMAEFRGRYRSMAGSVRALRRIGKGTLAATLDAKFEAVEPAFAHRGDLVMADDGQWVDGRCGGALCVSFGAFAIGVGSEGQHEGLVKVDRRHWQRAWRVA
ncbi:hypothetical protein SAMN05444678_102271 [Sphingomonas sp. YR710]|uniref:DUF6950 family protein n=1 Tax=Sphingomonas sp. YR710 TaxID=1882773 RepID=UPI0008895030|nr:hypothetical protein [Sphingomonas sp. YR710]SDC31189.1 hypothetical protein SAMN05444678_102271 [Sphingomonas sp. YR710]